MVLQVFFESKSKYHKLVTQFEIFQIQAQQEKR